MTLAPTDQAVQTRALLWEQAIPWAMQELYLRGDLARPLAQRGADAVARSLGDVGSAAGGWAVVICAAALSRYVVEFIPPRADGGPESSYTSGAVWTARIGAAAGDRLLALATDGVRSDGVPSRGVPSDGVPSDGVPLSSRAPDAESAARLRTALEPRRGETSPAAVATTPFVELACTELAERLPGIDDAQAGWALAATGVWLRDDAAQITAALTRRRGLFHGPLRYAPDGAALAGTLLGRAGLALLG